MATARTRTLPARPAPLLAVRRLVALMACASMAAALAGPGVAAARPPDVVSVIVREHQDAGQRPEQAVRALGGRVVRQLGVPGMFLAQLDARAVPTLRRAIGVLGVSPDAQVTMSSVDGAPESTERGSVTSIVRLIGADRYWAAGYIGKGVDVALIDSGVAPVNGLTRSGKVVNGPDLSFERNAKNLRYLDTFGHGTHMAGIIAGRDDAADGISATNDKHFLGVAPGAGIVSLKVADAFGTTDVSQVIAAIGWVLRHGQRDGLNVRVLNLSFGTDATQAYVKDPLSFAVEQAWRQGIFVVVAAGNREYGDAELNSPATDPFVMAVGASGRNGTDERADDTVASFSSPGTRRRGPDLVAPGVSVLSLRVPGSFIDQEYPAARVGDTPRLFLGSGTSQAAAVVSGAAALVISQRPGIGPDALKRLLMQTAYSLPSADASAQGAGLLDLERAFGAETPSGFTQEFKPSRGDGSLQEARGSHVLARSGSELRGEVDIFGQPMDQKARKDLLGGSEEYQRLIGAMARWFDGCWCVETWAGTAFASFNWSLGDWTGRSWTSDAWEGRSWTVIGWDGRSWSGRTWTSRSWSGDTWSSSAWGK